MFLLSLFLFATLNTAKDYFFSKLLQLNIVKDYFFSKLLQLNYS